MSRNRILQISLLLSLAAISAAQAGTTISDKRYWPNEVGPGAYGAGGSRAELNSAFASSRNKSSPLIAPELNQSGNAWRYQGGPKSR